MSRHLFTITLTVFSFCFLLTCTPDDPFHQPGNATGTLKVSSEYGTIIDSVYYDSTNHPIGITATLFLPHFIEEAFVFLSYEDSTADTLPIIKGASSDEEHLMFDTSRTFHRGGEILVYLSILRTDGAAFTDSAKVYLYRSPVLLSEIGMNAAELQPEFSDSVFTYSASVCNEQDAVTFNAMTENPYAAIIFNDSIFLSTDSTSACSLRVGENTFSFDVIADDDSTITHYIVNVTRKKSSIATLDSIGFSSGELAPPFHPDSTDGYTIVVENSIDSLTFMPFTTHPEATVFPDSSLFGFDTLSGFWRLILPTGETKLNIPVIAEDDSTTIDYAITIIRKKSTVASLDSVLFSEGECTPAFSPDSTSGYRIVLGKNTDSITITPFPSHSEARCSIDTLFFDSKHLSRTIPIAFGDTGIEITVTAEDEKTTRTYGFTISRINTSDASLKHITLTGGTLTPAFSPAVTEYSVALSNNDSLISLSAVPLQSDARILIDNETGTADFTIPLGKDTVRISVLAADNETEMNYDIIFTRAKNNNTKLRTLHTSSGILTPEFDNDIHEYALNVSDSVDTIFFDAVTYHDNAVVKINGSQSPAAITPEPMSNTPVAIVVTAEDGSKKSSWTITVTKKGSSLARLAALQLTAGELEPSFNSDSLNYRIRIPADSASISIRPLSLHDRSTITANGNSVATGEWTSDIPVAQGNENTITLAVTSENGKSQRTYTLSVSRAYWLTITGSDGGATEPDGKIESFQSSGTAISALPDEGFHFNRWSSVSGKASVSNDRDSDTKVDVSSNAVLQAEFSPNRYQLTLTNNGYGSAFGPDSLYHNRADTISARPSQGYHFSVWRIQSGNAVIADSTSAVTTIITNANPVALEAHFTRNTYQLTLSDDGNGSTNGSGQVIFNEAHTIFASADDHFHFSVWRITEGEALLSDSLNVNTTVTVIDGPVTITAHFSPDRYLCNVADDGNCTVSSSDSATHGIPFTISAIPENGYHFTGWSVISGTAAISNAEEASATVTLENGDATIQANCERNRFQLNVSGYGNGTVDGTDSVSFGVPHAVTATPAAGYVLSHWEVAGGDVTIADNTAQSTTVTLTNGDAFIVAIFTMITFEKRYNQADESAGLSIVGTSDGGYILAGQIRTAGSDNHDAYLLKTDCFGDTLWTRTFGGSGYDVFNSVRQTADEGYILCGRTESFGSSSDMYCIKTDHAGNEIWSHTYGGDSYENGAAVKETNDNGFILTGYSHSFGARDYNDYYLVKTDANGDTVWTETFDNGEEDWAYDVIQTSDNGYLICGYSYLVHAGRSEPDIFIIKTDANGTTDWTKAFGDADSYESVHSVQQTSDGGYIIAGNTNRTGNNDVYLIKTNTDGDAIWTETFGGPDRDYCYEVKETIDGGYVCTGYYTNNASVRNLYLFKVNGNGTLEWERIMESSRSAEGRAVHPVSEGGFIVTGSFNGSLYLIKTDANGLIN